MGRSDPATHVLHCGPLTAAVTRTGRNRLLLQLRGELDLASAEDLERRLFLPRSTRIDLDLSELSFVDVDGVRLLEMIVQKRGGQGRMVACSPAAGRALEGAGVGWMLPGDTR